MTLRVRNQSGAPLQDLAVQSTHAAFVVRLADGEGPAAGRPPGQACVLMVVVAPTLKAPPPPLHPEVLRLRLRLTW